MSTQPLPVDEGTLLAALRNVKGIVAAEILRNADYEPLHALEKQAGNQAIMGLGNVVNTGMSRVLSCRPGFVGLTDMTFDWGCRSALILTKAGRLAGEEMRDEAKLARLQGDPNAWFMHPNFVIYKDRIDFPRDLMKNRCQFEIPALPADWWVWPDSGRFERWSAMPAASTDLYLKKHYFDNPQGEGLGTVLVGGRQHQKPETDG